MAALADGALCSRCISAGRTSDYDDHGNMVASHAASRHGVAAAGALMNIHTRIGKNIQTIARILG
jgi:hypothetical protein